MTSTRSQRLCKPSHAALEATPSQPPSNVKLSLKVKKNPLASLRNWEQMITIECIDDNDKDKTFSVHKSFITHHCAYYKAAFNGKFIEEGTQSIQAFPITVESFSIFINWVYTLRIEDEDGSLPAVNELINLWILADEKIAPKLQNQAIDALYEAITKTGDLPTDLFALICERTMPTSGLRRLIVDLCVGQLGKLEFGDEVPREMLVDILKASGEPKGKGGKLGKERLKKYHVDEEVPESRGGSTASDAVTLSP